MMDLSWMNKYAQCHIPWEPVQEKKGPRLSKGQRVWFYEGKKSFIVREANERFAICTQPYNFRPNTVVYAIIDFKSGIRGKDNMVFSTHDYFSDEDCMDAMKDLMNGTMEVRRRHHKHVKPDIVKVK